jgi:y4mF family transcriptional regulator
MKLTHFIREKRKESGLTQQGLADKAGVGLRFVRELERGKTSLRMDKVNQVLVLFGYALGPLPVNRDTLVHETSQDTAA